MGVAINLQTEQQTAAHRKIYFGKTEAIHSAPGVPHLLNNDRGLVELSFFELANFFTATRIVFVAFAAKNVI